MDTIEYKNHIIEILPDDDPMNPCKEFDMLGTQVYWHNRYNLGHDKSTSLLSPGQWLIEKIEHARSEGMSDDEAEILRYDLNKALREFEKYYFALPVFAYEHGGITISTREFTDRWDSGQIGIIYVSYDKIKAEFSVKHVTKKTLKRVAEILMAEVKEYDDYLTGNVWGYRVKNDDDDILDSCGGFYGNEGREEAEYQAKQFIDWKIQEEEKELRLYDERMKFGYSEA